MLSLRNLQENFPFIPSYSPEWSGLLICIRLSGTGAIDRILPNTGENKPTQRLPQTIYSDQVMDMFIGTPIFLGHPEDLETGKVLQNPLNFQIFSVGTVLKAIYIKRMGQIKVEELWGIAKITDLGAIKYILNSDFSSSPGIISRIKSFKGIFYETDIIPKHVAIVEEGNWDTEETSVGIIKSQHPFAKENLNYLEDCITDKEEILKFLKEENSEITKFNFNSFSQEVKNMIYVKKEEQNDFNSIGDSAPDKQETPPTNGNQSEDPKGDAAPENQPSEPEADPKGDSSPTPAPTTSIDDLNDKISKLEEELRDKTSKLQAVKGDAYNPTGSSTSNTTNEETSNPESKGDSKPVNQTQPVNQTPPAKQSYNVQTRTVDENRINARTAQILHNIHNEGKDYTHVYNAREAPQENLRNLLKVVAEDNDRTLILRNSLTNDQLLEEFSVLADSVCESLLKNRNIESSVTYEVELGDRKKEIRNFTQSLVHEHQSTQKRISNNGGHNV